MTDVLAALAALGVTPDKLTAALANQAANATVASVLAAPAAPAAPVGLSDRHVWTRNAAPGEVRAVAARLNVTVNTHGALGQADRDKVADAMVAAGVPVPTGPAAPAAAPAAPAAAPAAPQTMTMPDGSVLALVNGQWVPAPAAAPVIPEATKAKWLGSRIPFGAVAPAGTVLGDTIHIPFRPGTPDKPKPGKGLIAPVVRIWGRFDENDPTSEVVVSLDANAGVWLES